MTVDPRIGMWLSVGLAIIGALAGSTAQLTTILGDHQAQIVLALAVLLLTVGNAVNAVLHAIPSSIPTTTKAANKFPLGPKASTP